MDSNKNTIHTQQLTNTRSSSEHSSVELSFFFRSFPSSHIGQRSVFCGLFGVLAAELIEGAQTKPKACVRNQLLLNSFLRL